MDCPEMVAKDTFGQGARLLARDGLGSSGVPLNAMLILFTTTPIPSTSFNSLPRCPITKLACDGTFIDNVRTLARVVFG